MRRRPQQSPVLRGTLCPVVLQLPNVSRVQLPLTNGITQCGNTQTNQYQVTLSLSGANGLPTEITLSPVPANCQNEETAFVAPATSATFLFSSRQSFVCTLSTAPLEFAASSVLTAQGTGETEVVIVSARAVNSAFPSATPSPTRWFKSNNPAHIDSLRQQLRATRGAQKPYGK